MTADRDHPWVRGMAGDLVPGAHVQRGGVVRVHARRHGHEARLGVGDALAIAYKIARNRFDQDAVAGLTASKGGFERRP